MQKLDDNSKNSSFKTASPGCACTEYRAMLNISESLKQKEPSINSDTLISKAILLLLCRSFGCVPLSTKTVGPI